jgi:hypothetical protein
MNGEFFVSFLMQTPWVFLVGLILILGVALAGTFSEKPGRSHPSGTERTRPR